MKGILFKVFFFRKPIHIYKKARLETSKLAKENPTIDELYNKFS